MSDWARAGVLGRSRMIVDVLRATHRRFVRDRMVDGAAGLAFYRRLFGQPPSPSWGRRAAARSRQVG